MRLITILLSALSVLVLGAATASADTRAVYTIPNIPVDKTAANTREAEAQAFAEAKIVGLQQLVRKLTLPEDRASLPEDFFSYANANAFAAAVDVDNEKRSATVYRADLSVVFNPTRIRTAFDQVGVSYVDRQSAPSLVVPLASGLAMTDDWRRQWPDRNGSALNPFVTAKGVYNSASNWGEFATEARTVGVRNAVVASLLGEAGNYRVRLVRETSGGATTLGVTNPVGSLEEAVLAATQFMDISWKRQSVVRGGSVTSSAATVRYANLRDWNDIRRTMASSPLVSEFQVTSMSIDGALVEFSFSGDESRLSSELRQNGIRLDTATTGWVMSKAFRRSQ